MKLRLLSVGRDRSQLFEPAVQEYAKRLGRYVKFELVEVPEARQADEAQAREKEALDLVSKLKPREKLWLLDEHGQEWDSRGLSTAMAKVMDSGLDLAFAIGGPSGHGPAIRERADKVVSLSKLTLPHRLARVVVAEQLYRAFTLMRGEPYHRD